MTSHPAAPETDGPTFNRPAVPLDDEWDADGIIGPLTRVERHLRALADSNSSENRRVVRRAQENFALLLGAMDATNAGQASRKLGLLWHIRRGWDEEEASPFGAVRGRLLSVAINHEERRWGIGVGVSYPCFGQHDFILTPTRWEDWERPARALLGPTDEEMALYRGAEWGTALASTLLAHLRRPEGRPGRVSARELARANMATVPVLTALKQACLMALYYSEPKLRRSELHDELRGAGDMLGSACLDMIEAAVEFDSENVSQSRRGLPDPRAEATARMPKI